MTGISDYSNSVFTLLTKYSIVTGFLIKHPIIIDGYKSRKALSFTSPDDIKQIFGLGSISNILMDSSNPFIIGIAISINNKSKKFALKVDRASRALL
jgi:hypothetical protein